MNNEILYIIIYRAVGYHIPQLILHLQINTHGIIIFMISNIKVTQSHYVFVSLLAQYQSL
jgi:hypothetical protein